MQKKLPQGWSEEYLVDVVDVINDSVKEYQGERNYLSTGDLNFNLIENLELVTFANKPSRANQNVKTNDVIFAKMKDTKKTLVINEDIKDTIVSTGFFVLRTKEIIDSRYLYFYLNSYKFLSDKNNLCTGATQSALNLQGLKKIKILLPTIEDQLKIVNILKIAEQALEKRKEAINLLDKLVKSQFIEMFGDLEKNINNFDKVKMKDICNKITDGTHKTPNYLSYGIKFISAKDIKTGKIDLTNTKYISVEEYEEIQKRCQLEIGDILLSKSGSIGTPVVLDTDEPLGIFESLAVLKLKSNIINNIYVCEFLKSYSAQKKILFGTKGISIKHLHLNVLKELEILIPPIELQKQFADFVKQVDKLKFEMEESLKELENNFNSLMKDAFSGNLSL